MKNDIELKSKSKNLNNYILCERKDKNFIIYVYRFGELIKIKNTSKSFTRIMQKWNKI